jgi:tRNA A-37 threonylcarbamoyl transferase component Bud32
MNAPHANHPSPAQLAAFAVGKLTDGDARAVAAHLQSCPDCRRAAERAPGDSFVARVRDARPTQSPGGTPLPDPVAAGGPPAASSATGGPPVATSPAPDLPPELVNHPRYQILRELGRGGMGVVYQARQTAMDRSVVIKVISQALLEHPDAVERFRREVKAAARLAHPNIVTAHDAEQAGNLHMLVMEFVPGRTLAEVLHQQGPLPVAHACHYVRQAALGLQHAFEQGMVHRDVKPHNLMLTPKGQVKILDFGLAKVASECGKGRGLTSVNVYMGTPEYSAPEQATDARSADVRADIYSLGCTLYCLLAGRPPFQEETEVDTLMAHLKREPTPLPELRPEVPAALWAVVARILAKDPGRRYQQPAQVAQALLPFRQPGQPRSAPSAAAPAAGMASADRGTRPAASTSRVSRLGRGASKSYATVAEPSPPRGLAEAAAPSRPARGAWRKRMLLFGSTACAAVALAVVAGTILRVRMKLRGGEAGGTQTGAAPVLPGPASLPPQTEIEKARAQLERSRQEARKKLISDFESTLQHLARADPSGGGEKAMIEVVKAERERFDRRGLLPWSEPMRPYMLAYLHAVRATRETIGHVYSAEIDELVRQKQGEKAGQLRAELRGLPGGEVAARWTHHWADNSKVITLCTNGKIDDPDGEESWTFENGVLRLRWPNPDAPGGTWIDTCTVSRDGKMYSGQNQLRAPISGVYSEEE